jgi:excisionase family DNA binding protein
MMKTKKETTSKKLVAKSAELRLADARNLPPELPLDVNKDRLLPAGTLVWQKDPRAAGNKLAYSVKEAAEALGVSAWYIRDEMAQGHLAFSCPRGRQMIPRWELVRYLESAMSQTTQLAQGSVAQAATLLLNTKSRGVMA